MAEQPRKRRASVPVSEKLDDIDAQIARHEQAIENLRDKRAQIVLQQKARAKAMLAEIGEA